MAPGASASNAANVEATEGSAASETAAASALLMRGWVYRLGTPVRVDSCEGASKLKREYSS